MHGESQLSSVRISHIGGQNYQSDVDDMRGGLCDIESIEDVLKSEEPRNKWITCEIEDFDVGKHD
ncbi:hypothetical protein PIB30_070156 [Stylosanthes scabra]|uniref:Uncharacterized protein n=1 Tax=Stylosanthes scabra TaxID=79078 RepID=A0ABU6QPK6_9FABA|nr:hypothetical protein [Stylosanthes scabra]